MTADEIEALEKTLRQFSTITPKEKMKAADALAKLRTENERIKHDWSNKDAAWREQAAEDALTIERLTREKHAAEEYAMQIIKLSRANVARAESAERERDDVNKSREAVLEELSRLTRERDEARHHAGARLLALRETENELEAAERQVATLRAALRFLVEQIVKCDFIDPVGHKAIMNKAFIDAQAALAETEKKDVD